MYLLFRLHHWKPEDYYKMGFGQRTIVRQLILKELKDMEEETD